MTAVLLADKLTGRAVEVLEEAGIEVIESPGLEPGDLKEALKDVDGVICRSGATFSSDILETADRLKAICRAGVGVDNIDIEAASRKGIAVMNTPGANTISTAEHTMALMLALARNVGPAYISMRNGVWDRRKFTGDELCGTTLGIIGLGRVGQAVARRAKAFEMDVIAYDPFISHKPAEQIGVELLDELESVLKRSDYLTVHIPKGSDTKGFIGAEEIAVMKSGARIINCSRGEVVDMEAVVEAVKEGRLAGGAFDVFKEEPPGDYSFAENDRILVTPHLGASTEAAQIAVGVQAAAQMVEALQNDTFSNAVNIAAATPEEMKRAGPFCELARKLGRCAAMLNRGRVRSLEVLCRGEVAGYNITPVENHAIMGVLQAVVGDEVNMVSAPYLARERGIEYRSTCAHETGGGFTNLIDVRLSTDRDEVKVAGAVLGRLHQRIVMIDHFHTEVLPESFLLLVFGLDKPGLIGGIGDVLGRRGVNIARMTFGRRDMGGNAMLALNLDSRCDDDAIGEIEKIKWVEKAVMIVL